MKKTLKTIALLPMWPLIWYQLGFSLDFDNCDSPCDVCGRYDLSRCRCCQRAKALVNWWDK